MVNLFLRETTCLYAPEVHIPPRIPDDLLGPLRQLVPMTAPPSAAQYDRLPIVHRFDFPWNLCR